MTRKQKTSRSRRRSPHFRQGDVLIQRIAEIPADATDITPKEGPIVLAYGKVTGHSHAIPRGGVALLERGARRYLRVDEATSIRHEEHSTIDLAPGAYETRDASGVGIVQVEYTPGAIRRVED